MGVPGWLSCHSLLSWQAWRWWVWFWLLLHLCKSVDTNISVISIRFYIALFSVSDLSYNLWTRTGEKRSHLIHNNGTFLSPAFMTTLIVISGLTVYYLFKTINIWVWLWAWSCFLEVSGSFVIDSTQNGLCLLSRKPPGSPPPSPPCI